MRHKASNSAKARVLFQGSRTAATGWKESRRYYVGERRLCTRLGMTEILLKQTLGLNWKTVIDLHV